MSSKHPTFWFGLLMVAAIGGVAAVSSPALWAQTDGDGGGAGADDAPLRAGDLPKIRESLRTGAVVASGSGRLRSAFTGAVDAAECALRHSGVDPARDALRAGETVRASRYVDSFLRASNAGPCPGNSSKYSDDSDVEAERSRAWLLSGRLLLERDRPDAALEQFGRVDAASTPIPDYVYWLRARAHDAAGRDAKAADLYGRVHAVDESPLHYRARALQAHALVDGDRSREALPILRTLLDLFPDYPRRFRLLYDRARALEAVGRLAEAAEAYQTAWFEFPHKPTGELAMARLEALEERGIEARRLSARKLFGRYRELRIHKHWDLAERLFQRLLDRIAPDGRETKLAHEIQMQLALNAYIPKHDERALRHLRELRRDWKNGHRSGIHIDLVDKYLSRTLSRLGRYAEAEKVLRRRLRRYRDYTEKRELIEFYRDHSRYEEAYQLADDFYSDARKGRWPYLWLLYKTGRFERAKEGFATYAKHRSGRRAAKATYWRARILERTDAPKKARKLFAQVAEQYATSYYGIQAVNRLRDLEERTAVDRLFSEHTGSVVDTGEEVFAAFDTASRGARDDRRDPPADPTMVPRRADDAPDAGVSAADCLGGTEAERTFCRLLAGDVPADTLQVIGRAVVPFQSPEPERIERASKRSAAASNGSESAPSEAAKANGSGANEPPHDRPRIDYPTEGRVYWEGRSGSQDAFDRWARGQVVGPVPDPVRAYDGRSHVGGAERAARKAGDLLGALDRAHWLFDIGMFSEARTAARDAALEFRGIAERYRPPDGRPHELPHRRWTYLIDYRRYSDGYWGYEGDPVERYPVPDSAAARRELADRQQEIWDRRETLRPLLVDALKEVGDYHLVRRFTQEQGGWYNQSPTGPQRRMWMQAYPRAFPHEVVDESREHGMNPYLIWALMTVESAYNPDSISTAEAIGLLQVIPRTGIKVASWIGDEDFGPYDLTNERVAIGQGTYYFSSLVEKFRGQELLAMAGYNGGPHRVATWLQQKDEMPLDEFVEEIPFDQARLYVKKVTRYLSLYMRIYEGRKRLYVGQNLDPDARPRPNF